MPSLFGETRGCTKEAIGKESVTRASLDAKGGRREGESNEVEEREGSGRPSLFFPLSIKKCSLFFGRKQRGAASFFVPGFSISLSLSLSPRATAADCRLQSMCKCLSCLLSLCYSFRAFVFFPLLK